MLFQIKSQLRGVLFIFITLTLSSGCATAQKIGDNQNVSVDNQRIYVCNQGAATLSVIDVEINEVSETIDLQELGFSANAMPHHAVAEPDGSYWYLTLIGENLVLKFNRQNELVAQAEIEVPGMLSLHPTKDLLLVGRSMSAVNPPKSIVFIRRSDMTMQEEIDTFFARPHASVISPDGEWSFIGSLADNQILTINNETWETDISSYKGDAHVFVDFAISPDNKTMVATGQISGKALFFDLSDPTSPILTDTLDVNAQPWHPVYSHDGENIYFGNKAAHTVTVIDARNQQVEAVIEGDGLAQPHGAVLSSDGKYLYVSNNNRNGTYRVDSSKPVEEQPGTITVINTETQTIEKIINVGAYPSGIGTQAR
ncbi:MAG: YncE family protein [Balneolaceae bacterium]|nr:YncE family protein [Balneolaceae bacterium]MDR9409924.1 YncE family protein [Balneolaceae bacterium]